MKRILITSVALACLSTAPAFAQTTQQGVVGASGNPAYPVSVRGSNGQLFSCKKEITTRADGRRARTCIPADDAAGTVFSSGAGIGVSPAAGAVFIAVLAAAAGGGSSTATTGALASAASDIRLKSDITRVGTTVHGLPLYHFRYTGSSQMYEGVMAQDVQAVLPEAVVTMDNGYLAVRYGLLGLEMRAVQ